MNSTEKRSLSASAPENDDQKRPRNDEEAPAWAVNLFNSMEERITSQLTSIIDLRMQKLELVSQRCDSMEDSINKNSEDIVELFNENRELKQALAEQIDRGMRNNLNITGIIRNPTEKSWDDCRDVLATELAKASSTPDKNVAYWTSAIERAHRAPAKPGNIPVIHSKFKIWDDVNYILNLFKKPNAKLGFQAFEQFSERTSERRKKALARRKELKAADPTIKSYVRYPADLRVKKLTDNDYKTVATF